MGNSEPNRNFASVAALVVTGFGIGWLAGLSVSPVVSIVLTSLTGVAATLIAALSGVKEEFLNTDNSPTAVKRLLRMVTPVPLAWLVIGVIIGASTGLWVRTHNWLSPDQPVPPPPLTLQQEVQQWVDLGMDKDDVVTKYFASRVSLPPITAAITTPRPTTQASILFTSASQEECEAWQALIDKGSYTDLATEVATSQVIPFRQLPIIITDTVQLAAIVGEVLCVESVS